ncbi:MAG: hypothetical protein ACE37H_11965 [Phycisphaeraceae bacterium]
MNDEILMELLYEEVHALVEKYVPREEPIFDVIWESYWEAAGAKSLAAVDPDLAWSSLPTSIIKIGAQGGGADFDCMPLINSYNDIAEALLHMKDTRDVTEARAANTVSAKLDGRQVEDWQKQIVQDCYAESMVRLAREYERRCGLAVENSPRQSTPTVFAVRLFNNKVQVLNRIQRSLLVGLDEPGYYDLLVDECGEGGPLIEVGGPSHKLLVPTDLQYAQRRLIGLILSRLHKKYSDLDFDHEQLLEWCHSSSREKNAAERALTRFRQALGKSLVNRMIKWDREDEVYRIHIHEWSMLWIRKDEHLELSRFAHEGVR